MLTVDQATKHITTAFPNSEIHKPIDYRDIYIFKVFDLEDLEEGSMDPFYSVNKETGEIKDYSIIADGDISEIMDLFEKGGF